MPHGKGQGWGGRFAGMMGGKGCDPQAMVMGAMMGAMVANMMGGNMTGGTRWDAHGGDSWEDDADITYKGKGKGKRW